MNFKDRYDKILKQNRLGVQDVVELTGMSRDAYYRMMSGNSTDKYERLEKLFAICETPEQVVELAVGDRPLKSSQITPCCQAEMLGVVKELMKEVRELREELKKIREGPKSAQVLLPQKIPECH